MIVNTQSLKEFFLSFGYTEEDYIKIISNPRIKKHSNDYVIKKVNEVHAFLLKYYTREEVIKMVRMFTSIFTYSVSNMGNKMGSTIETDRTSSDDHESESMEEVMTGLMTLGYTKKNVLNIIKVFPQVFGYSMRRINKKINDIVEVGKTKIKGKKTAVYTRDDAIKMVKFFPQLLGSSKNKLTVAIKNIVSLGQIDENGKKIQVYRRIDALSIARKYPVVFKVSKERLENSLQNILSQGYSIREALRVIKKTPSILGNDTEYIKNRIEALTSLGYSMQDAKEMLSVAPTLYDISKDLLLDKRDALIEAGYTEGEVFQMAKVAPMILTSSISGMQEKINYYDSVGMHDFMFHNPKQFIQSVALSYARYMFFKDSGIDVESIGFDRLFWDEKSFCRRFGVSKQMLLEKYDYSDRQKETSDNIQK